jgi:hypothetical protein
MKPSTPCRTATFVTLLTGAVIGNADGQELSVLDPRAIQLITQEVSGDAAYEHIRFMTQFHRPRGGHDNLWRVAEYYERKAREYGLSDVTLIRQTSTTRPWNARFADLWIVEPEPMRIASTLQSALHLADYSHSADVTAELVDIGAGSDADYEGRDVSGKVVLTFGSLFGAMEEAVCARGALGVIWYPSPFASDNGINGGGRARPDQLRWIGLPSVGLGDCEPTFAFGLSLDGGADLRALLQGADEPVRVRAFVDAAFASKHGPEPWQVMVEGYIRGADPGVGQDIVFTGHLQEEGTSANDDASGTASTLEVARALNRLIEEGRVPRPRRNLRFWWVTEISSQRQYFADHPDAPDEIWVNINQDMVGANQAQDVMRKQNITRLPATRFHFFNDVVEAVVEYMVAANTFELAQLQAGVPFYPKPHLAHRGSDHRYNADVVFFHNNTDHMTFTETPIGVPGVTFTNMPDRFVHSSDDDLWNVDPTQLGRNAAAAALIGYAMAIADSGSMSVLAAETVGRGVERLGRNLRLGLSWIATADDKAAAYLKAVDQVRFAAERERAAVRSLGEIGESGSRLIPALMEELATRERGILREVEGAYQRATGGRPSPRRQLSEVERRLAGMRPVLVGGPQEFHEKRGDIGGVRGLHPLMAFEVLNAVSGDRSGLDIYRYVAAEAREAGSHYYGTVSPDAVLEFLQNAVGTELIRP